MNTSDVDFSYPVLGISSDNDAWGFPDFHGLTTCGPRTLRDRMQDGMELIDADGRRWRVISIKSLGRSGFILTRWLRALLMGPEFRIQHELEALEPLAYERIQEKVCKAILAHPEFWCDDPDDAAELSERLAEVKAAASVAGIYEVLGLDTFQSY